MELSLSSIAKHYSDEPAAWEFLESIRWPNGPVCPHCGTVGHAYFLKPKQPRTSRTGKVSHRRLWKCGERQCGKQFTVLVGTIFESSKIPLSKWLLAFHLMCANKNGVAAYELHRTLEISYEAAWFMSHRIRYALTETSFASMLTGTVEADETYVGGRRKHIPGVSHTDLKTPVVTLVQRDGQARSKVLPTVTSKNIKAHLQVHVSPDAALMTDQSRLYNQAGQGFASHETVDHARDEWVRGKAHVNTAEGYFSQLKRSLDGTYHHVSPRHLRRYVAEFDFRYNTRKDKDSDRTLRAIRRSAGKRLKYEQTIKTRDDR
jgi:transposase-like protein